MNNAGKVALGAVLAGGLAVAGCTLGSILIATAPTPKRVEASAQPAKVEPKATRELKYTIEGVGTATTISYGENGQTEQANGATLPWSTTKAIPKGFVVVVITAQKATDDASAITCIVAIDGVEKSRKTSTGPYAVVSCSS